MLCLSWIHVENRHQRQAQGLREVTEDELPTINQSNMGGVQKAKMST